MFGENKLDTDVVCEFSLNAAEVQRILKDLNPKTFEDYIPIWTGLPGNLSRRAAKIMYELGKNSPFQILEVDPDYGQRTISLALGLRDGNLDRKIWVVCPDLPTIQMKNLEGQPMEYTINAGFQRNISRFDLQNYVTVIDTYKNLSSGLYLIDENMKPNEL